MHIFNAGRCAVVLAMFLGSGVTSVSAAVHASTLTEIEQKLRSPTTVTFRDASIHDIARYLLESHDISTVLDQNELSILDIDPDLPLIDLKVHDISLRSALRLALRDVDLTFVVYCDVLFFTSIEVAECDLETRYYSVIDLGPDRLYELANMVTTVLQPTSWPLNMRVEFLIDREHDALVIEQTQECHLLLEQLLQDLRSAKHGVRPPLAAAELALASRVDFQIDAATLGRALQQLRDQFAVNIVLDASEDVDLERRTAAANYQNMLLEDAISLFLLPHRLGVIVKDEVLMITSLEYSQCAVSTVVYPVRDLIEAGMSSPPGKRHPLVCRVIEGTHRAHWNRGNFTIADYQPANALICRQTGWGHRLVAKRLSNLRMQAQNNAKIELTLARDAEFRFKNNSLRELASFVAKTYDIQVAIDNSAVIELGIDPNAHVITRELVGISLDSALKLTLRDFDLGFMVAEGQLLITEYEIAHPAAGCAFQ